MNSDEQDPPLPPADTPSAKRTNVWQISTFLLLAILLGVLAVWVFNSVLLPSEFKPVTLNSKEQQVLDEKLQRFERFQSQADRRASRSRFVAGVGDACLCEWNGRRSTPPVSALQNRFRCDTINLAALRI